VLAEIETPNLDVDTRSIERDRGLQFPRIERPDMPGNASETPTVFDRLLRSRQRIEGEGEDGLQAWYRDEIESRTGWKPAKSTVHRYVRGATALDERARETLEAIEGEAEKAGPYEPTDESDLLDLGAKKERNALLIADWVRGASLSELGNSYGISKTMVAKIVERANVRRIGHLD